MHVGYIEFETCQGKLIVHVTLTISYTHYLPVCNSQVTDCPSSEDLVKVCFVSIFESAAKLSYSVIRKSRVSGQPLD